MMDHIYQAFVADEYIQQQAGGRIKYYEYPETATMSEPHIIIDPLDVPMPRDFADNQWLTNDYLYQIEVWSKDRKTTKAISERIRKVMWKLGYYQGSGVDEYDQDEHIFRDARRYRGKEYDTL